MLTAAITVLFTVAGIVGLATVVHCLIGARAAYAQLMREGEVMRAGFALQAAAVEMSLRRPVAVAPRRAAAPRRMVMPLGPVLPRPACAA